MCIIGCYEIDCLISTHEHLHGKICVLRSIDYFIVNLFRNNDFKFQYTCLFSKIIYRIVRIWFPNEKIAEFSNLTSPISISLLLFHMWLRMSCSDTKINNVVGARTNFYSLLHSTLWYHFALSAFYSSKIIMMRLTLYWITMLY